VTAVVVAFCGAVRTAALGDVNALTYLAIWSDLWIVGHELVYFGYGGERCCGSRFWLLCFGLPGLVRWVRSALGGIVWLWIEVERYGS
jgi:hypothetical protein